MAAEAESRKELLLKHGLAEEILTGLEAALDQFETALEQGAAGRWRTSAPRPSWNAVAEEVVQEREGDERPDSLPVRHQPELLAAWESASNVVAAPRPRMPSRRREERRPRVVKSSQQHEGRRRSARITRSPAGSSTRRGFWYHGTFDARKIAEARLASARARSSSEEQAPVSWTV